MITAYEGATTALIEKNKKKSPTSSLTKGKETTEVDAHTALAMIGNG